MSGIQPPHPAFHQKYSNQCFQKLVTTVKTAGSSTSWEEEKKEEKNNQGKKQSNQNYKTKQKQPFMLSCVCTQQLRKLGIFLRQH